MLARIEPSEIHDFSHMFRFDVSPASNFVNEWGDYLVRCDEACYVISAYLNRDVFVFLVPDQNFFIRMKLSCNISMNVIVRGHNYEQD